MKSLLLAILLLPGVAITVAAQGAERVSKPRIDITETKPQPQLYELRCRGGSSFVFGAGVPVEFKQVGERTTTSGDVIVTLEAYFFSFDAQRAAGADNSGLSTGSCAWVDRPLRGSEATMRILFDTPANSQLKQKLHGTPVDTSPTAAERYPDAQTIPVYMKDPAHYWSFFGITKGDHFQASYHKLWTKPPPPPPPYETKPGWVDPKKLTKP
jgi:hypothetical protein